MSRALRFACVIGVLGGIFSEVAAQCDYEVVQIIKRPGCDVPCPYPIFGGTAMSDNGDVGGIYWDRVSLQAVAWSEESGIAPLPHLSGFLWPGVSDLNSVNEVVGWAFSHTLDYRAVIWRNGVPSRLPDWPGSNTSGAAAINRDGWIAGFWGETIYGPGTAAVIWKPDGSMVNVHADLPGTNSRAYDINDLGQVMGVIWFFADARTFFWDNGQGTLLPVIPGGFSSRGYAMNNQGHVVGIGRLTPLGASTHITHAFFWDGVTMIDLGTLPGFERSWAFGINDVDQVVGNALRNSRYPRSNGFLWQDGVMINLSDFLPEELEGFRSGVVAITRNGEILMNAGGVAIILAPVGSKPGDIDNNCSVNVSDLLLLIDEWGKSISVADINLDGTVNQKDLLILIRNLDRRRNRKPKAES